MSDILSRSLSFTRYHVQELPADLNIFAKLTQFAFMPIDDNCDEYSFGWTNFDDYLDTNWHLSSPEKGEYLCISLRYDQRKIVPSVFKKEFKLALEKEYKRLAEQGWKFISKDRKKEIKENTRLMLLSKTMPTPSWMQIVWDIRTNDILAFSSSKVMNGLFMDLFGRTFETVIQPYEATVIDKIYEASPVGAEIAVGDFLTWLWYRSDCGIPVSHDEGYECMIGKAGKMMLTDNENADTCSVSGSIDVLADAFSSMKRGKDVKKAQFILPSDILFELDSNNPGKIALKNLPKTTPLEDGDDPDAPILERIYQVEESIGLIDAFFEEYLSLMSNAEAWNREQVEIANWIKSDYE